MRAMISRFFKSESGAVSADWVVLTAALAGFGIIVITVVVGGATDNATGVGAFMGAVTVGD